MARFQFFGRHRQTTLTDRRLTDGQNRLLNPASRMRARGKNISILTNVDVIKVNDKVVHIV